MLEIGSGTGLIMFPLLPHVEAYVGSDLSRVAVDRLKQQLESPSLRQTVHGLGRASLVQRRCADDLAWIEPHSFDTVVLASVVQYFPGLDYLAQVLKDLIGRVVAPGGAIFLGDVRSMPLLKAFHATVQLHKSSDEVPIDELAQRVRSQLAREQELAIAPEFFVELAEQMPQIQSVEILPKRGRRLNEMARFRYDVIIRLAGETLHASDVKQVAAPLPGGIDWREGRPSVAEIRRELTEESPAALAYHHVGNSRVAEALQVLQWLSSSGEQEHPSELGNVGQLNLALKATKQDGHDPEDFWELAEELPYVVGVSLAVRDDGSFDVVFTHRDAKAPAFVNSGERVSARGNGHGNNPLREKLARRSRQSSAIS